MEPRTFRSPVGGTDQLQEFERPDLLYERTCTPVTLNPPHKFFQDPYIPGVGKLMLAQFTNDITKSMADHKWWMGEKYDGIRFCWNPTHKLIYGRNITRISLAHNLIQCLPSTFLDGELWFGRGEFPESAGLFNDEINVVNWSQLRLVSFDEPSYMSQKKAFEERYQCLLDKITIDHPFIKVASRMLSKGSNQVNTFAKEIITNQGEGLMLRKTRSLYENGRSLSLLKYKTWHCDAEGIVVEVNKYKDVVLKLKSGRTLLVHSSEVMITPLAGDVVTFTYDINSPHDLPLNPRIVRIRHDLIWPDGANTAATLDTTKHLNKSNQESWQNIEKRRAFFEQYAKAHGFDSLRPDDWYMQSSIQFLETKGANGVLSYHNYSLQNALVDLFPNIGLDKTKFTSTEIWRSRENRKKFFENFANYYKFNSRDPNSWYSQSRERIYSAKGASVVMSYHSNSVPQALLDLFPDIGLDEFSFPKQYWKIKHLRNAGVQ